jgi:hypothetical protein
MPKQRQTDRFKRGDRVKVTTWENRIGRVLGRSSRTDGILYDVAGDDWSGTFYASSLRKVH